jgi:hypothetical protein
VHQCSTLSLTSLLDEVVVNATPRQLYSRERDPVPIVEKAGWAPGAVWMGAICWGYIMNFFGILHEFFNYF